MTHECTTQPILNIRIVIMVIAIAVVVFVVVADVVFPNVFLWSPVVIIIETMTRFLTMIVMNMTNRKLHIPPASSVVNSSCLR